MNSPHPNFGSKDDIFLLESQHWNGGLPTHSMLSPHACHRNNDSCCNIHHNCSLHNSDNHLHLDFLTCIYCKVFYSWCPLPPSISSFHTLFLGKQPKQREGEHWAGSGTSSSKRYVCFDRWVILLISLISERFRDTSWSSARRTSGSLWLLPTWTFRPRCESDAKSHWSHLNCFPALLLAGGAGEAAACSSISLLGGSPFSTTKRWWYASSFSNFFFCPKSSSFSSRLKRTKTTQGTLWS